MEDNNKKAKGFAKFLSEKGFYIVLFICAAVIGVCAWLLWFSAKNSSIDSSIDSSTVTAPDYTKTEIDIPSPGKTAEDSAGLEEALVGEDTDSVSVGSWDDEYAEDTETNAAGENDVSEAEVSVEAEADAESETASAPEPGDINTVWPVSGEISAGYSIDELMYSKTMADWRTHDGIDIEASVGSKVRAMADGTVSEIYNDDMLGTTVVIDHGGGLMSVYSNLAETPTVAEGDTVKMGDTIGSVGATALLETAEAAHLHLSVTLNGDSVDPTDYL